MVTALLQWIRNHTILFEERKVPASYEEIEVRGLAVWATRGDSRGWGSGDLSSPGCTAPSPQLQVPFGAPWFLRCPFSLGQEQPTWPLQLPPASPAQAWRGSPCLALQECPSRWGRAIRAGGLRTEWAPGVGWGCAQSLSWRGGRGL